MSKSDLWPVLFGVPVRFIRSFMADCSRETSDDTSETEEGRNDILGL